MKNQTKITRHAVSSVYVDCVDLTNADEVIIIYPYGDIYEIFAVRKGDKYEIEFDRDILLVSLDDAKTIAEIWYDEENIVAIRNYFTTMKWMTAIKNNN